MDTFEEKLENNIWEHNLQEVIDVIKGLATPAQYEGIRWRWTRNTRCKYVSIRIDMRDGGFVLLDRDGKRISLEQLQQNNGV